MTNPELDPPIEYPDSWRPARAPPFEPSLKRPLSSCGWPAWTKTNTRRWNGV